MLLIHGFNEGPESWSDKGIKGSDPGPTLVEQLVQNPDVVVATFDYGGSYGNTALGLFDLGGIGTNPILNAINFSKQAYWHRKPSCGRIRKSSARR